MTQTSIFKTAFNNYNNKLKNLNDYYNFVNLTKIINLDEISLTDEDKSLILSILAHKKNLGNAGAGDFENVIDILFEEKSELLNIIQQYFVTVQDPELKKKLKMFMQILFAKATAEAHIINPKINKVLMTSWTYPYNGRVHNIEKTLDKIYKNRKFMFEKSLNENYLPTTKANTTDEYGFHNLSIYNLLTLFYPSNFYKLDSKQIEALCQALVNKHCEAMNVIPCKVNFKEINSNSKYLTSGEYNVNEGYIDINKRYLTGFNIAKNQNNLSFPLRLMTTLVHEAEHRVQFANLDKPSTSEMDTLVKDSIMNPNNKDYLVYPSNNASFENYLSEPDEMAARNVSLAYLEEMVNMKASNNSEIEKIAMYYNNILDEEQENQKLEYKENYKKFFSQIFNKNRFNLYNVKGLMAEVDASNYQSYSILKSTDCNDFMLNYNFPVLDF